MNKDDLRKKYKQLRSQLTTADIEDLSIKIANQLLSQPIWEKSNYHLFLPIIKQKEVNTEFVLNLLMGKDKNVIISKSNFKDTSLSHYLLTDTTPIKNNVLGIPEPVDGISIPSSSIDVVFIPLLAYDTIGNRVGYGKGFYDKFLSECKPDTLKIGLSFFDAENEIDNLLDTDIRLDMCITPDKVLFFNK